MFKMCYKYYVFFETYIFFTFFCILNMSFL